MDDVVTAKTIGEVVAADFRAAAVLERFGIDFCCSRRRSLAEACRAAATDLEEVSRALDALPPPLDAGDEATRWPLPRLIDFIIATHHGYVRSAMPQIAARIEKLREIYGGRHPELARVAAYFDQVRADLEQHMMKEERVLFPYVRELAEHPGGCGGTRSPFGTIANPIRMMEREHEEVGEAMRIIRELTRGYAVPEDSCTTYQIGMTELRQFERDLHRHVHLENNVLFPAALRREGECCGSLEVDAS